MDELHLAVVRSQVFQTGVAVEDHNLEVLAQVLQSFYVANSHPQAVTVRSHSLLVQLRHQVILLMRNASVLYEVSEHSLKRKDNQRSFHLIHPPSEEVAVRSFVDFGSGWQQVHVLVILRSDLTLLGRVELLAVEHVQGLRVEHVFFLQFQRWPQVHWTALLAVLFRSIYHCVLGGLRVAVFYSYQIRVIWRSHLDAVGAASLVFHGKYFSVWLLLLSIIFSRCDFVWEQNLGVGFMGAVLQSHASVEWLWRYRINFLILINGKVFINLTLLLGVIGGLAVRVHGHPKLDSFQFLF